jgi:uncharacterized protein
MSQEQVKLTQRLYEAFGRGDIPTVLEAMDPNIEWNEPQASGYPSAGTHRGPQEVSSIVFGTIPQYYQEFAIIPQEFVDAGERVFVLGEAVGKGKASGTAFRVSLVHILTFRDGKWVRFQEITDAGTIAAALK